MFKFVVLCGCLLAVAQAGIITVPLPGGGSAVALASPASLAVPTISTSNIIRGIGNLGQLTAFTKSVDTPFSSVRKADVRINNPDIVTASVAAPALAVANTALAAPVGAAITAPGLIATAPHLHAGLSPIGLGGHLGLTSPLGHVKVLA